MRWRTARRRKREIPIPVLLNHPAEVAVVEEEEVTRTKMTNNFLIT